MTELNICNMKFEYSEIGDMIKASKGLYSWDFTLDGKRHKVDLTHSRIKGKRTVACDGQDINTCLIYTYNYTYSFPLDGHYLTLIQISPDQYDLRIDNISFMLLKNKSRYKRKEQEKKKNYDDDYDKKKNDNDDNNFFNDAGGFDFGDSNNNKAENFGDIANDFDFGDDDDKKEKKKEK